MNPHLDVAPEVRDALAAGRPVVALESTVIAHGMAYPKNLETALAVEAVVRAGGAVPASAAVIGGRLKAGLSEAEIGRIAKAGDIMKATARDLGYLAATGGDGATTVAATMRITALAGIPVFATGGIGGVHRGAAESFDISADLQEMTASRVAVVAAGAKSILDIGATLERLESLGVPVAVYGSDRFPAFYARDSGFAAPLRLDDSPAIARLMRAHWALGGGGLLIANPIPAEDEIPAAVIDKAIAAALAEMAERRIGGKAATPFLLARVAEISGGASLKANIALIKNNARLAAAVAVAFAAPGKG
jgi:pseudouridine-5'-phosphate glycosidase